MPRVRHGAIYFIMKSRQLLLDEAFRQKVFHGGSEGIGKRKTARPLVTKRPMHLVFKAEVSTLRRKGNLSYIEQVTKTLSKNFFVRIYKLSINSNHLHLIVQAKNKKGLQDFLRAMGSNIAIHVSGACKGKPLTGKFWSHPVWTRIIEWGKPFQIALSYVQKNILESLGLIPYRRDCRINKME